MASAAQTRIHELIKQATDQSKNGAPGIVFLAINDRGEQLMSDASGYRDLSAKEPMREDSVFWIASCTKLVTSVAVMQLVERGILALDDADQVAKLIPEVANARVLQNGKEYPQEKSITLRNLLTHTSGLAYTFLWQEYWDLLERDGSRDEFQGLFENFKQPLRYQPGSDREYSIGIDWAGIMLERATGLKLGDYFAKNIFQPLNIANSAIIPTESMRSRLCSMNKRDEDGKVYPREHLNKIAPNEGGDFHSGGAGLFTTASDFCMLLSTLLNDGVSPSTNKRIISSTTLNTMFSNHIPEWQEKYAGRGHPICRTDLAVAALRDDVVPAEREGWGLSFLLSGVNLQVASAAGVSNCFWVLDREKKVAGVLFSQILPLGDPVVWKLWLDLQTEMFN